MSAAEIRSRVRLEPNAPPRATEPEGTEPLWVLTAAEMRALDARAVEHHEIPVDLLMERAGFGAVAAMATRWGDLHGYRAAVVCGRGHNGGDGLVAARALAARGVEVEAFVLGERESLAGLVAENAERLGETGARLHVSEGGVAVRAWLEGRRWDFVLDALLGTGSRGAPREAFADAVHAIAGARARGARVVALDLPTGLDADDGRCAEPHVEADLTVTFAYLKRGHLLWPGRGACGAIEVLDIGIPPRAAVEAGCAVRLTTASEAASLVPVRAPRAHKGNAGRGLVIGGSVGMGGAVALAARASLRAGLGLVRAAIPESVNAGLEAQLVEPITVPMPEHEKRGLSRAALPRLSELAQGVTAIAVGPGLGPEEESRALAVELLASIDAPAVVDADGLNALAAVPGWAERVQAPLVLTPHLGEMSRLTGEAAETLEERRIDAALEWARRWGVVVLLKGAPTVIASPDGRAALNPTGNPGMASAGMGDVLTGCVLAYLGAGLPDYDAARLAAWVHGRAADRLCAARGVALCLAGEVADELPAAAAELQALRGGAALPRPLPEGRRPLPDVRPPGEPTSRGETR